MARTSATPFHNQWPNVISSADLPNDPASATQSESLEVGDICFDESSQTYFVCVDSSRGAAFWRPFVLRNDTLFTPAIHSVGGTSAIQVSDSRVDVSLPLRSDRSFQIVSANMPVFAVQERSVELELRSQSIQYIDASAEDVSLQLPKIDETTVYLTFLVKRVDESENAARLIAASEQLIDSAEAVALSFEEAVEVQAALIGRTYGWKILRKYAPGR
jgi:hypothetical protein